MVICEECLELLAEEGCVSEVYDYEAPYYATKVRCEKCGKEFEPNDFYKLCEVA